MLGKLAPGDLTVHAAALVAKLKDSSDVREAAMETLRKLAPEDLALLGDAVVRGVRPAHQMGSLRCVSPRPHPCSCMRPLTATPS